MTAKLSAKLPEYPENGMEAIAHKLVTEPAEVKIAIVRLDTTRLTTDLDTGYIVPTARILSIEPLRDEGSIETALDLMRLAFEARTGLAELPFETADRATQAEADQLLHGGPGAFITRSAGRDL